MERFGALTGRRYKLFDYFGAPDAERVLVLMGSGVETARETVEYLSERGEKVGVIQVHLYRPFSVEHFLAALPVSARTVAVLDRTKEPGSTGEPLYQDALVALNEASTEGRLTTAAVPRVVGGRYGLSSRSSHRLWSRVSSTSWTRTARRTTSPSASRTMSRTRASTTIRPSARSRRMFSRHVLRPWRRRDRRGEQEHHQDHRRGPGLLRAGLLRLRLKKSGSRTVSHLRFGPRPIRSAYLIGEADFIGCHQFDFINTTDVLANASEGATVLLNSPYGPEEVWDHLPRQIQERILEKKLKLYLIDGNRVARETGMGTRTNTIMQTCFFAISGVLPREEAIEKIKKSIQKTYGKKGEEVVRKNFEASSIRSPTCTRPSSRNR